MLGHPILKLPISFDCCWQPSIPCCNVSSRQVDANVISWLQEDPLQLPDQPPVVHAGAEHTGKHLELLASHTLVKFWTAAAVALCSYRWYLERTASGWLLDIASQW
ncbi:hypothetical protein WJX77_006154 [Trebouxia sp. C0004]